MFLDGQIIDETNMPGATLGTRRLQCGRKDLLPLKQAIFSIFDLLHAKKKFFIDHKGRTIIYEKTKSSKLSCYKIKKVERKETASLLWLTGIDSPFTIPRPPREDLRWARVLHLNSLPWQLYDYVSFPSKDTYRRV